MGAAPGPLSTFDVGSYFQTAAGFGLGMIVVGEASGLDVAPAVKAAAVVSLVSLDNGAIVLPGRRHQVDRRACTASALVMVPAIVAGVCLLDRLRAPTACLLQLLHGLMNTFGDLRYAPRPRLMAERSSDTQFVGTGAAGGLMSALFDVPGRR